MKIKRRVMKKKVQRFLKHIRKPSNEFGYLVYTLKGRDHPNILSANIYIDDGNKWIDLGNKKIILFQTNNNFDRDWDSIIPMTIENEPKILGKTKNMELTQSEIEKLKDFVRMNQTDLINIARGKIDHREFFENTGFYEESDCEEGTLKDIAEKFQDVAISFRKMIEPLMKENKRQEPALESEKKE